MTDAPAPDPESVSPARQAVLALRQEVGKVVVGQDGTLSGVVAAMLVNGHVLLEGVPGRGQDAVDQGGQRRTRSGLPAGAVHARSHAVAT